MIEYDKLNKFLLFWNACRFTEEKFYVVRCLPSTLQQCAWCVRVFYLVGYLSFFGGERKKKKHETLVSKIFGGKKTGDWSSKEILLKKDPPLTFLCLKLYWTINPSPPLKSIGHASKLAKKMTHQQPYILNYIFCVPTLSHHHREISIDLLNKSIFSCWKFGAKLQIPTSKFLGVHII